jgi:outer membrane receptor protein involved in Fe transport
MPASRTNRSRRSLTITSVLLLSTALAAPAFAQIEEVVVTAQKRAEDVQTVPIAITAFTSQDLTTKQIKSFDDLQYNVPNVTYARSNFGAGADFQIRGIGVTAIGYDAEAGVAIVVDNVYLESPPLANGDFYDLSDVEVLAGPQSTLYGRGAVGGVVSITTARPDLDAGSAQLMASYGNYNSKELEGDVNMPLVTDELAVRISGDWIDHSGYVTDIYNGSHPDNEDEYSFRGSVRWTPTSNSTLDLVGSMSNENDNAMRSQKQLCTNDPTGVLGCLPGSAGNQAINPYSTLGFIASSQQGMENAYGAVVGNPTAAALGLYNLTSAEPALTSPLPTGARQVSTDFDPTYQAHDEFLSAEWKQQNITPWLDADLVLGYDHDSVVSQESYNNVPGATLPEPNLAIAEGTFTALAETFYGDNCALTGGTNCAAGAAAYAAHYAPYFAVPGELPISSVQNLGVTGGDYKYTPYSEAYDQSNGEANQWSAELRFDSHFSGPFNFRLGGYYLSERTTGNYYVNASTLDYPGIILGGLTPVVTDTLADFGIIPSGSPTNASANAACLANGCILGPSYYNNNGTFNSLTDAALYGELYYTVIPDTLKLTAGLRFSEDDKDQVGRIELYSAYIPIGTTNETNALATAVSQGQVTFAAPPAGNNFYEISHAQFDEYTGHFTADWTPKLSFTDQTLVYATFSRGYKAGGFNPGIEPGLSISPTYAPEFINDYELGTKNTLLKGTLQANGDLWYYDYTGLQVSEIANNTSLNNNINAKLYGAEGEFVYQPIDQLTFTLNIAETHTSIGPNTYLVDQRNPTGGDPKAVLIKDDTISASTGENCVLYWTGAGNAPSPATLGIPGYSNPNGGSTALQSPIPQDNVQQANFGPCNPSASQLLALTAAGFSTTGNAAAHQFADGQEVNLKGNELQDTPDFDTTIGVNWLQPVGGDYNVVAHVEYYWQSHSWGRIFEDGSDYMPGYGNMNATLTLNAPDNKWFVQAFIKNVFGTTALQGEYLTSPTSGLYTNGVYGDPRLYGLKVGIKL